MDAQASENIETPESFGSSVNASAEAADDLDVGGVFTFTCVDPDGNVKWEEEIPNQVVDEGETYVLDVAFSGATQVSTHYIGLIEGSSPSIAESDTLSSKSWTENQDYDEANRQTWSEGGVSSQSIDNSGSPASFTMNASVTIGGAFLTQSNTKGGTSGVLIAAGTFGTARSVGSGDTLNVTYTISA